MQPMEIDIRDSPAMEPEKKLGQIINGQSQPGIIQIKSTKDGFKTPPENDYPSQRSTLQKEARKNWPDKDKEFRIATEDQGEHASIQSQPLYSTFSQSQKYFITAMVTFAAFFSPVSASIYFPILNTLASNLKVTNTLINLTITSYMIFQGLAPMVFGTFADQLGRRPAYIVAFTIYLGANIGLALQDSYVALLLLRCLQSTGSSGTIAIGIGVVSDISTSSERGSYMGMVLGGTMLGPAVGPIIGGLLSHFLGWQAIFWFLVIGSGSFLIVYIIFVSETSREVVGNGSVPPQRWNLSVINWAQLRRQSKIERKNVDVEKRLQKLEPALKGNKSLPNPLQAIYIMLEKDVAIVVLYNALVFAAFYDITASLPMLFKQIYKFNDLQIGLSYLYAPLQNAYMYYVILLINETLIDPSESAVA